jgi:uncharacterized protein (TIGR04255 family)
VTLGMGFFMELPIKLGIEPLVDVVVEIRFKADMPVSTVLPGMLFNALPGTKSIERLPHAEIPAPIRHANPELRYAPTIRIVWGQFLISMGDYSLSVACKIPYPGWAAFKAAILQVFGVFTAAKFVQSVERCAFKSTDIIEKKHGGPKDVMQLVLTAGNTDLTETLFQVRSEIVDGDVLHIVLLASEASVALATGGERVGMVIDTDTIHDLGNVSLEEFSAKMSDHLELVHEKNKRMFFSYLKADFLKKLEPVYG